MLEGQENRLGSEIRRMFGENPPIVGHKASWGKFNRYYRSIGSEPTTEILPKEDEIMKRKCSYKDFSMSKPPTYNGIVDPIIIYK